MAPCTEPLSVRKRLSHPHAHRGGVVCTDVCPVGDAWSFCSTEAGTGAQPWWRPGSPPGVTNYLPTSQLRQQTLIILQFLWVRNLGAAEAGFCRQARCHVGFIGQPDCWLTSEWERRERKAQRAQGPSPTVFYNLILEATSHRSAVFWSHKPPLL